MGITHFNGVSGVKGVYMGAKGKEIPLALITYVRESFTVEDMEDNGTTGTYVLQNKLPKGAVPLGWAFEVEGAFKGDTSAIMKVGVAGTLDQFTACNNVSVYDAGIVGSLSKTIDSCKSIGSDAAVVITITSDSDFTKVVNDGTGKGTLHLYYIGYRR